MFSTIIAKDLIMQHEKFQIYTLKINTIIWHCKKKIRLLLNKGVRNANGYVPDIPYDFFRNSYELHMNFMLNSYDMQTNFIRDSYDEVPDVSNDFHCKFIWRSNKIHMNHTKDSYGFPLQYTKISVRLYVIHIIHITCALEVSYVSSNF